MNSEELFQKIKDALISINFSPEEADRQLKELSDIILTAFHDKMSTFTGDKSDQKAVSGILVEAAAPIINDYFKEVSGGLREGEKKEFLAKLNSLTN